jgi:CHRD domain
MSRRPTILVVAALAAMLLVAIGGATASADSKRALAVKVTMTGDQEVVGTGPTPTCAPPATCGDADAVGTAKIHIVPALDRICFQLEWSGIDGTVWGAHIHGRADANHATGIVVPFLMLNPADPTNHLSGTDSLAGCMSDADALDIAAEPSLYYVNVHSTVFGPGAVRAQLGD